MPCCWLVGLGSMTDARGLVPRFSAGPHLGLVDIEPRVLRNADVAWNTFSSSDYWRRNYAELQPEDREIIRLVSHFFAAAFADRAARSAGHRRRSGTNLYPALLMLPWAKQILLTDFSESNVRWLKINSRMTRPEWRWHPFWREMRDGRGYSDVRQPRKRLRDACAAEPGYAGIEQMQCVRPAAGAIGTLAPMFFVAESITEDPAEFAATRRVLRWRAEARRPVCGGLHGGLGRLSGRDGTPTSRPCRLPRPMTSRGTSPRLGCAS